MRMTNLETIGRSSARLYRVPVMVLIGLFAIGFLTPEAERFLNQAALHAAQVDATNLKPTPPGREPAPELPAAQVAVAPQVTDQQIAQRLLKIMQATPDWFYEPNVVVQDGVAFLRGQAMTQERKVWAGELARNTEGVVAVVNLIDVMQSRLWDFGPAMAGIYDLWRTSLQRLPWLVFGLVVMILAYIGARITESVLLLLFKRRIGSQLLRGIAAWLGGAVVFLGGLYVVLYVAGLTGLVLTVLGGTGLIGLVLGIGFRDITENFLSSIFLSVQTPFRNGDMVELNGVTGIVQRMTNRATMLMTFEGNHVQIPNAVVYKSTIINYTSNPNRREDFTVNIGYDAAIEKAQAVALGVLREHPAVLADPEPMVLAVGLAPGSVTLRIFFWVNVHDHDRMKVKSAVIRLVKHRFEEERISLPDGTKEMVFARDVQVRLLETHRDAKEPTPEPRQPAKKAVGHEQVATSSEGGLASEADSLKQQAERSRQPEGEDLLKPPDEAPVS
jgi:small-conductance mechanosensitive channel